MALAFGNSFLMSDPGIFIIFIRMWTEAHRLLNGAERSL